MLTVAVNYVDLQTHKITLHEMYNIKVDKWIQMMQSSIFSNTAVRISNIASWIQLHKDPILEKSYILRNVLYWTILRAGYLAKKSYDFSVNFRVSL